VLNCWLLNRLINFVESSICCFVDSGLRDARLFVALRHREARSDPEYPFLLHKNKSFLNMWMEICWKNLQIRFAFPISLYICGSSYGGLCAADIKKHEALCSSCVRKREKFAGK